MNLERLLKNTTNRNELLKRLYEDKRITLEDYLKYKETRVVINVSKPKIEESDKQRTSESTKSCTNFNIEKEDETDHRFTTVELEDMMSNSEITQLEYLELYREAIKIETRGCKVGRKDAFNNINELKRVVLINKNFEVNHIFDSVTECAEAIGSNKSVVSKVARGKRNHTKGYIVCYEKNLTKLMEFVDLVVDLKNVEDLEFDSKRWVNLGDYEPFRVWLLEQDEDFKPSDIPCHFKGEYEGAQCFNEKRERKYIARRFSNMNRNYKEE